ncbi:MAG: BBP7 family outer membrane beta-barrel protein [Planctomycetales bacterium]|nr:BBP7 family outer membrane beta-barrel protein [Planctomycetales bacterium]
MKTNCLLTVGVALLLLSFTATPLRAENARFRERVATWQSPQGPRGTAARSGGSEVRAAAWEEDDSAPARVANSKSRFVEESVDEWTADGDFAGGCGEACCSDWCGDHCGPRLWWIRKEGLLFWGKGRSLPPLVTTSDTPVPPPGTTVLFGGQTENSNARVGARVDFGTFLGCDEFIGVGGRFWGLANDDTSFSLNSTDLSGQTIERPFLQAPNTPNSLVIADPFNEFNGNIRITTRSEVFGADAYVRVRCRQSCMSRTDFVTGYQFTRINESLRIASDTQNGSLVVNDYYGTYNEFHGGVLGVLHDYNYGCVNLMLLARVGLGNMHQTAVALGETNGQQGGLYVESNAKVVRDKFCAAPELSATLGYQFSPCMQIHIGYTMLYWSNVARPEAVIDQVRGDNTSIVFRDSSFWVQGVSGGLTVTF